MRRKCYLDARQEWTAVRDLCQDLDGEASVIAMTARVALLPSHLTLGDIDAVPVCAPYWRFVSDLAGYDLPRYDGKEESIVRRVVAWLTVHPEALSDVKPSDVLTKLPRFRPQTAELKMERGDVRRRFRDAPYIALFNDPAPGAQTSASEC